MFLLSFHSFFDLPLDFLADARSDHTNSTSDNYCNEYVNLCNVPYTHLPSQAGRGGVTRRTSPFLGAHSQKPQALQLTLIPFRAE